VNKQDRPMSFVKRFSLAALPFVLSIGVAAAQETERADPSATLNGALLLLAGLFMMLMVAGFSMKQAGVVRERSAAAISLRSLAAYALAALSFWLLGYNLVFGVEPGGFLGVFHLWSPRAADPALDRASAGEDWLFQMGCAALTAMIVAGALGERVRLWSFLIFAVLLAGVIYPIEASWSWGGGYLAANWSFGDLAGASVVHSAGGWAALAGALVIGTRPMRHEERQARQSTGGNLPLASLGALVLWFAWFGYLGGAQVAAGGTYDPFSLGKIFVNATIAAAASVFTAMVFTQVVYKKIDLPMILSAAIGGLVSISAEPLAPAIWQAAVIGAFGGVIVTVAASVLERTRIEDVGGVIPAHLGCGVWATLIVPWSSHHAHWPGQIIGILMIGAFSFVMSLFIWVLLKYTIGIRVSAERDYLGLDRAELGLDPESSYDD